MSLRKDSNRETSSESTTPLAAITSFSFVITLITVKNLMGYTVGLSRKLQGRSQDSISAYMNVQSVLSLLVEVRENVDCKFLAWYEEAVVMGKEHDIVPSVGNETAVMFLEKHLMITFDVHSVFRILMN